MIFRKIICIFAIILSIGISIFCRPVFAQEKFLEDNIIVSDSTTSNGLMYKFNDNEIIITGHLDKDISFLEIPSMIGGLPVTEIYGRAFYQFPELSLVIIPDSITYIGAEAFKGCENLDTVNFKCNDNAIKYDKLRIDKDVFQGTPFINNQKTSISYAKLWTGLSDYLDKVYALSCNQNETVAIIEDGTKYIADRIFAGHYNLQSIVVPGSVKEIPNGFAINCGNLTSVTLSEGITTIGFAAFSNCKNLKNIAIPASVTKIEDLDYGVNGMGYYLSEETKKDTKIPEFTITGYTDTVAQTYAEKHGFKFISLGSLKKGDANMDGSVNVDDASLVLSYYAKKSAGLNPDSDKIFANIKLGDVDENGSVEVDDASKILNYYAKEAAGLTPNWD